MGLWTIEMSTILASTTCKWMFHKHLEVIKVAYCQPKKVCTNVWVLEVLLASPLDIQQSMFKLAMKSNTLDAMAKPTYLNPLTLFWCTFSTNILFSCSFLSISNWQKLSWYKFLIVWKMSIASVVWHSTNSSYRINSLIIWV
jgi:hypothetical protein